MSNRTIAPARAAVPIDHDNGVASSFAELQDEAEALRTRINRFRTALGRFYVAKQEILDLMTVAAVAQEPERAAQELLSLAEAHFGDRVPTAAIATVRTMFGW